jgi:hypothetical protein
MLLLLLWHGLDPAELAAPQRLALRQAQASVALQQLHTAVVPAGSCPRPLPE